MQRRYLLTLVCVLCSLGPWAAAQYVMQDVENVPLERVTTNLRRMIAANPKDVDLVVNLARVHAMGYAKQAQEIAVYRAGRGAGMPFFGFEPAHRQIDPIIAGAARARVAVHLEAAIATYRQALAIQPDHQVALIGLGWTLIQAGEKIAARDPLRRVIVAAWPVESKQDSASDGRSVVEEAAHYLLRVLDPVADAAEIAGLRVQVGQLQKRSRWITPIAVPLKPALTAREIATDDAAVLFDADGSGIAKRWTWITFSDRGEVHTLAAQGVAAISTTFERDACHPDRIAWSPRGVTLTDGSTRPTFDLILRSAGSGTVSVR